MYIVDTQYLATEADTKRFIDTVYDDYLKHFDAYTLFLEGDLGAGKTCSIRYLLDHYAIKHAIVIPTYTYVQHYNNPYNGSTIYHFDAYRLDKQLFLEKGFMEYSTDDTAIKLVEWASKLPVEIINTFTKPHFHIHLEHYNNGRNAVLMHNN